MKEKRSITCIVCPVGCTIDIFTDNGTIKGIEGYSCKRGLDYAQNEFLNPTRVITSTARINGGCYPVIPVKTDSPIAKDLIFECMKVINSLVLNTPVETGDVIVKNVLGTGANIVVTRSME